MSDGGRSKVMEFYRDSTVLITGASGFVGQVLLEKILRCLEVRRVYVMIRSKRNLNAEDRLEKMLKGQLFDRIRDDPLVSRELRSKVVPVEIKLEGADELIVDDLNSKLQEQVEIVFNLLASVNFNEPLDCALKTNVEYTDRLLGLVSRMKRLKSVIHVSTFYSNCDKSFIEERIYDDISFGGYANIMNIVSKLNDTEKQLLTEHLIGDFPNTYTFSKKCAEVLILDKFKSLPIGIFRPPIVSSTYREPVPGWIDNFNGPSGMVVPLSEGLYSAALLDSRKRPFIVPVDYCVNALLSSAVDVQRRHMRGSEIPVYNYTDSSCNLTWGEIVNRFFQGLTFGKRLLATYLTGTVTRNPLHYSMCKQIMRLQASLLDLLRRASGRSPVMGPIFERMITLSELLRFFCVNEWQMENGNVKQMLAEASILEARVFPFDLSKVNWDEYYRNFVPGVVKYAVEPRKAKDAGRTKLVVNERKGALFLVWSFLFRNLIVVFKFIFGSWKK
ncbi:fatty acyl-CoA reductase wat-like [Topomyia yanbarensis]|uniref:fatty acyl-CoA reductase wat-like n=1 Tax=Topomyia yanbarensis TaxID=2498891 RepID=UPI00273A7AF5|nr:fatty acyl-CoA reductase wat-like [Topomyia yanbarensis]